MDVDEPCVDSDFESQDQTAQRPIAPTHKLACTTCREKKIACDRLDPCSNCIKKGWNCEYPSRQRTAVKGQRIHITSVYENKISNIEKQLQHVIGMLEPYVSASSASAAPASESPRRKRPCIVSEGESSQAAPRFHAAFPLTPSTNTTSTPLSAFEGDSSLAAHTAMANTLLETAVSTSSLQPRMAEGMETLRQLISVNGEIPDAYGMASSHNSRLGSMPMLSQGDMSMPPIQAVLTVLDLMKGNPRFESMGFHMFLSATKFMGYLNRVYTPGEVPTLADFVIVNGALIDVFLRSILLTDDIDKRRDFQHHMNLCEGNLETALSRLPVHMPHTIDHITALTFSVYHAIRSSQTSLAWSLVTTAIHMSITAGFHRASSAKNESRQGTNQKAWLFWSLYSVEKGLSLRLGRPSSILDYDITVPLPQHDDPEITAYTSCFIRWIRLSIVQGKIYKMLYSPAALAESSERRAAWARSLVEETKKIYKQVLETSTQTSNNKWKTASGDETELSFFSEKVLFYSTLTLILKSLPPDEGSTHHFASECITAARTALEKHQEYCKALGPDSGRHIDVYVNWTILYNPFVPFIAIFCHVIESGDVQDLTRLQEFVASLESARMYSRATANIHRQFQALFNIAQQFIEIRTSNELLSDEAITEFDEYIQALGIFPSRMTYNDSLGLLPGAEADDVELNGWGWSQGR
ncbi:hypothetical protein CEP54_007293 [Fusarium duplospermum]|uniref:Zn(2)-C6 fungal-type domain-containing protein n=1 Tax=Fusarium duplospermum TaxID=1325734 RepID=A0A428Q235_9HYPO|nr:hypothetical protein CEP54_007293 [Fusarium duplospermum]